MPLFPPPFVPPAPPLCSSHVCAVVGTAFSTFFVAASLNLIVTHQLGTTFSLSLGELAAFGALISATDPVSTLAVFQQKKVDLQLFYLVFGESVVNDAVGLVLFDTCSKIVDSSSHEQSFDFAFTVANFSFILVASFILGMFFAVAFAVMFRFIDFKHNQGAELSLYIMIMYFPFVCAEFLGVSGIVTLLFTAMLSQRYVMPNISEKTEIEGEAAFKLIAHLSETSIFLILGISLIKVVREAEFHPCFFLWCLLACLVGRALHIYVLSFMYNSFHSKRCGAVFGERKKSLVKSQNSSNRMSGMIGRLSDADRERLKVGSDSKNDASGRNNGASGRNNGASGGNNGASGSNNGASEPEERAAVVEEEKKGEAEYSGRDEVAFDEDDFTLIIDGEEEESGDHEYPEPVGSSGSFHYGEGPGQADSIVLNTSYIPRKTQHMLCFSGLRGAVAFACAQNFPDDNGNRNNVLLITMLIVLASVFTLGSSTDAMLSFLRIEVDVDESKYELLISELKIRCVATIDMCLSRLALPREFWEFDARDTLTGYEGSLATLVGGGSSMFKRTSSPRASERYDRESSLVAGVVKMDTSGPIGVPVVQHRPKKSDGLYVGILKEKGSLSSTPVLSADSAMDKAVFHRLSGAERTEDLSKPLLGAEGEDGIYHSAGIAHSGRGGGGERDERVERERWESGKKRQEGRRAIVQAGGSGERGGRRGSARKLSPVVGGSGGVRTGRRRSLFDFGGNGRPNSGEEAVVEEEAVSEREERNRSKSSPQRYFEE